MNEVRKMIRRIIDWLFGKKQEACMYRLEFGQNKSILILKHKGTSLNFTEISDHTQILEYDGPKPDIYNVEFLQ